MAASRYPLAHGEFSNWKLTKRVKSSASSIMLKRLRTTQWSCRADASKALKHRHSFLRIV